MILLRHNKKAPPASHHGNQTAPNPAKPTKARHVSKGDTTMTTTYNSFTVTANYTGSKPAQWGDGNENWNHHKITVKNKDTGRQASFDFWASITNPELRTQYDVLNAFYCFVSDAVSGLMDIDDFQSEFGYEKDSECIKAYKGCQKAAAQMERIYDGDLYNLLNALAEDYA